MEDTELLGKWFKIQSEFGVTTWSAELLGKWFKMNSLKMKP